MKNTGVVQVLYEVVDGAHFFVSHDEMSKGLCVANTHMEVAYDAVSIQLEKLLKENYNMDVQVIPCMVFGKFAGWYANVSCYSAQYRLSEHYPRPKIAAVLHWNYVENDE